MSDLRGKKERAPVSRCKGGGEGAVVQQVAVRGVAVGLRVVQLPHAHPQAVAEGPPGGLPAVRPQAGGVGQVAQLLEAHAQALPQGWNGLGLLLLLSLKAGISLYQI